MLMDIGGKAFAAADGVTIVLRLASRTDMVGVLALLRQCIGWCARSEATASAAYARKPHRPPPREAFHQKS
jgi:hypothetical protein